MSDLELLSHHSDQDPPPGLVDLAVNVRAGGAPAWLAEHVAAADLAAYPNQTEAITAVAGRHGRARDEVIVVLRAVIGLVTRQWVSARVSRPMRGCSLPLAGCCSLC